MTHRWLLVQAERGQPTAFLKMVAGQERLYPGIISPALLGKYVWAWLVNEDDWVRRLGLCGFQFWACRLTRPVGRGVWAKAHGTHNNLEIINYLDSNFAGYVDSRKSILGYIFMFAGGAISWRSAKQTLIATSTMKAKFVSCFKATSHGVWMKSFISRLRIVDSICRPLKAFCDNSSTIFLANNNKRGSRSKHINIKYLAIREHVKDKTMVIEHVSTELMIANPLTKGMPPSKFKDHIDHMGLGLLV